MKKPQPHEWKVGELPKKDGYVDVLCAQCGVKMHWPGFQTFEEAYASAVRLRMINRGKPKDRIVLPDCNEEKMRRIHRQ